MAEEHSVVVVAKMLSYVVFGLGPATGANRVVWAAVGPKNRAPLVKSL